MLKKNKKAKASNAITTHDLYLLFQTEFFGSYDCSEIGTQSYAPLIKFHESIETVYIYLCSEHGFLELGIYTDASNLYQGELKDLTLSSVDSSRVKYDDSMYSNLIPPERYIPVFDITECFVGFNQLNAAPMYDVLKKNIDAYLELTVGQDFLSLRVYEESDVTNYMRCEDIIFAFDVNNRLTKIDVTNISKDAMTVIRNHLEV
jgi:hypothetical protein